MKISEIRDTYYEATDKVSDVVRQLALAGIAVIWVFRVGKDTGDITYSESMLWPLGLFVASLACDLSQYLYKSLIWGALNCVYWRRHGNNDKNVSVSGKWNWPAIAFFWLKAGSTVTGYGFLLDSVITQIKRG